MPQRAEFDFIVVRGWQRRMRAREPAERIGAEA